MEPQTNLGENHATERVSSPATAMPVQPRYVMPNQKQVERVGNLSSGVTHVFPTVRGGICDYCGVIDPNVPSHYQYKLCPHYRGMNLACSYCPAEKNMDDVIHHAVLRILEHPDNPNKLIIHCDSYGCKKKHEEKWKLSN